MNTNAITTDLIPLGLAADHLRQRSGRKPSTRTLRRWATLGRDGTVLRVVRIGGGWWTRLSWVERFLEELAHRPGPPGPAPVTATGPSPSRGRVEKALEYLRARGLKITRAENLSNLSEK